MRPYAFTKGGTEKKKRAQITYSEDAVDGEGEELESENDEDDDDDNGEPVAQVIIKDLKIIEKILYTILLKSINLQILIFFDR